MDVKIKCLACGRFKSVKGFDKYKDLCPTCKTEYKRWLRGVGIIEGSTALTGA